MHHSWLDEPFMVDTHKLAIPQADRKNKIYIYSIYIKEFKNMQMCICKHLGKKIKKL